VVARSRRAAVVGDRGCHGRAARPHPTAATRLGGGAWRRPRDPDLGVCCHVVSVPPKVPPSNSESHQRDWRISIQCREWKQVTRLATLNAGPSGIFLNTSRNPAIGSGVELQVELPNGNKLKLIGQVQRVFTAERAKAENRSPGVAIRLGPEQEAQLRRA